LGQCSFCLGYGKAVEIIPAAVLSKLTLKAHSGTTLNAVANSLNRWLTSSGRLVYLLFIHRSTIRLSVVFEVAHFRPVGNPTDPASVEIRFDN
jgi:hypothetical protein